MSEAIGIVSKMKFSEDALKRFLRSKQVLTEKIIQNSKIERKTNPENTVSSFMAELLYSCNNLSGNVFLFHYNIEKEELFFAYVLSRECWNDANAILSILKQGSRFQNLSNDSYVFCFSPFSMDVYDAYLFENGNSINNKNDVSEELLKEYADAFWSFFDKKTKSFPEPKKAIKNKTYFYRPIVLAYKKYIEQVEKEEKPQKIKTATQINPFHLVDFLYTWEGKVFDCLYGFKAPHELLDADPFTISKVGNVYADKSHVYKRNPEGGFFLITGIDGATYEIIGQDKHDYLYTKDYAHVYLNEQVVAGADVNTFINIGYGNGKDNKNVYYRDEVIEIDQTNYKIDKHGFIIDAKNIYHYGKKIDMDAATFKVVSYESNTNPFMGVFGLEDKNGIYEYDSIHLRLNKK